MCSCYAQGNLCYLNVLTVNTHGPHISVCMRCLIVFCVLCCLREHILKTAKVLVEDTKLLVSGAGASQEKLAQAAQSSVNTITKLADVVKLGAASLGSEDPETQVQPFKTRQSCLCLCKATKSSAFSCFYGNTH